MASYPNTGTQYYGTAVAPKGECSPHATLTMHHGTSHGELDTVLHPTRVFRLFSFPSLTSPTRFFLQCVQQRVQH